MSTPEQWELGGKIVDQGANHAAIATVRVAWDDVLTKLAEIQITSANLKRSGCGRTEDPTLVVARVVPALHELAEIAKLVATQLESRLGGA